jgi:SAM-dependent methyltransferase
MAANGVGTRAKAPVNIVEHDGVDFELLLLTEAVGLRSLHYGFWDETPSTDDLSFASLKDAQARFTDRLLAMIPPDVKSVLDVGSGVGDNSAAMLRRGLDVTALSPDKNHGKFYEHLEAEGVEFHNVKFEDFPFSRSYDLVLMSESQNYFDQTVGFEHAKRHLVPGGRLLVAGMFRRRDSKEFAAVQCIDKPYIEEAARHGFELKRTIDVTENVIGTIRMAERYLKPVIRVAQTYFDTGFFLKRWLASFLIAKRAMSPKRLCEYYAQWISPDYYRTHVKYQWLLFERGR